MIENFVVYKGGAYNETILFDAERFGGVNDDFMLDDSVLNYDTIIVTTKENDGLHSYYIPVSEFYASLNNPQRPWCNDGETLLIYPYSDFGVSVDSTSTAKIYKVIGVSNKHSKEEPETKVSTRLTTAGKQAFLDYCDTAWDTYNEFFMIAPLVSISDTVLKYYDYNAIIEDFIDGGTDVQTSEDVPLARYSKDIETFKSVATVIPTEDPNCPLYVYAGTDNGQWRVSMSYTPYMFYYCEKPLKFTNDDKTFLNTLWNKFYQLSLRGADVSEMTNMDNLFEVDQDDSSITPSLPSNISIFTTIIDVADWDTTNVTSMNNTFQDLARNYYTHKNRKVDYLLMFGLDTWDMSNVQTTTNMFKNGFKAEAEYESQDYVPLTRIVKFDNWDVTLVTNADYMFYGFCEEYIPSSLNFKNCKSMVGTLGSGYVNDPQFVTSSITNINWNTPKVSNMSYMVSSINFTNGYPNPGNFVCSLELRNLMTNNVENMSHMFEDANLMGYYSIHDYEYNFNNWDVSNVSNMNSMFLNTYVSDDSGNEVAINDWDVSYVTDMRHMFETHKDTGYAIALNGYEAEGINQWNTRNMEKYDYMFARIISEDDPLDDHSQLKFEIEDLQNWDMRKATSIAHMFDGQILSEVDLSSWDTSNISDFTGVFNNLYCRYDGDFDLSNWDLSNAANASKVLVFGNKVTMEEFSLTANNWKLGVYNQDILTPFTTAYYESSEPCELNLSVDNWDITQIHDINNLFEGLKIGGTFSMVNWDTSNIFNMDELFKDTDFQPNNSHTVDLIGWDVGNCTHFDNMFAFAEAPNQLLLDNWVVPSVFDFHDTGLLDTTIGNSNNDFMSASNWSFSSRTDLSNFFKDFYTNDKFTLTDISGWSTSDITNMSSMFENARMYDTTGYFGYYGIKVDGLESWDTGSVTNMSKMFKNIYINNNIGILPLSALDYWDISSCINFNQMLYTTDPTDWNYVWYDDTAPDDEKMRKRPNWDGYWDEDGTFHPNNGTISGTMEFVGVYQDFDTLGYYLEEHWKPSEAYINNGAFYIYDDQTDSNYNGLYVFDDGQWLVPNTLTLDSILAIFDQSKVGTITPSSSLDDLVPGLNVRQDYGAYGQGTITFWDFYNDGSEFANGYTLSGTLAVGTSTITVSITIDGTTYTDTIDVTVTADS